MRLGPSFFFLGLGVLAVPPLATAWLFLPLPTPSNLRQLPKRARPPRAAEEGSTVPSQTSAHVVDSPRTRKSSINDRWSRVKVENGYDQDKDEDEDERRLSPIQTPSNEPVSSTGHRPPEDEESVFIECRINRMLERRLDRWTPDEVFELMPILMQGSRLEDRLEQRLELATSVKEKVRLENSRAFLVNLKANEEARRCRAWVSAIVSAMGETPEALDEAVRDFLHHDSGLLTPLLKLLDDMIRQSKDESAVGGQEGKTPREVILGAVKNRIEAEAKVLGKPFVRILALALRHSSEAERELFLRQQLTSTQSARDFIAFLDEGIDYMARATLGPVALPEHTTEEMKKIVVIVRKFLGD